MHPAPTALPWIACDPHGPVDHFGKLRSWVAVGRRDRKREWEAAESMRWCWITGDVWLRE